MAGRVIFTVAYLSADIDPTEHIVLVKHIFDIRIDLAYGVNILVLISHLLLLPVFQEYR